MAVSFIPATPGAIEALTDNSILWFFGPSDLIAIAAIIIAIASPVINFFVRRRHDRVSMALDAHHEYNSTTMALLRREAISFVKDNDSIDWVGAKDISLFNKPDISAEGLFSIMRYFHRINVVHKRRRHDIATLSKLIGPELAWWNGFIFQRMEGRPWSRTIGDISELSRLIRTEMGDQEWSKYVQQGLIARI